MHPLWKRWLACAFALLIGLAGTAQAAHVHGKFLPENAAQMGQPASSAPLPGGEASCPLCVAMHSALPVSMATEPAVIEVLTAGAVAYVDRAADDEWHFAQFSRPPPPQVL